MRLLTFTTHPSESLSWDRELVLSMLVLKLQVRITGISQHNSNNLQLSLHWQESERRLSSYLGIVMHFVLESCCVTAFSSSSRPPVLFSFLTKLFTAFSDHLSSLSASPFFKLRSLFTIGGVKGEKVVMVAPQSYSVHKSVNQANYLAKWIVNSVHGYNINPKNTRFFAWKPNPP